MGDFGQESTIEHTVSFFINPFHLKYTGANFMKNVENTTWSCLLGIASLFAAFAASANELYVEPTGVGIGISSPERLLHLRGQNAVFRMDRPIDSAGFMLVRTDANFNPMKTFFIGVNSSGNNNGEFIVNDFGSATAGSATRRMTITNTGEVQFTGTVRAVSFAQTSSERFKTNVQKIHNPIEEMKKINGVRFNWKKDGSSSIGLIAEEVAAVFPEVVEIEENKPTAVNYAALVAVLLEAIKEQDRQINSQRSEIEEMKEKISHSASTKDVELRLVALEAAYSKLLVSETSRKNGVTTSFVLDTQNR